MGQKVTIGGERLGSGNKMQTTLKNYGRSTHNLARTFKSTMASGILYPCYVNVAMRGDSFTIDLDAAARTIPTQAPLFGSYKMQIDFFQCPWRLYQAILHNNPTAIGLKMNQVKLPMLKVETTVDPSLAENRYLQAGFSNSSLQKYLGMSGIGASVVPSQHTISREYLAIPTLAYYDICKNYYFNKQEENAYVISNKEYGSSTNFPEDESEVTTEPGARTVFTVNLQGKELSANGLMPIINNDTHIQIYVNGNITEEYEDILRIAFIYNGSTKVNETLRELKQRQGFTIESIYDDAEQWTRVHIIVNNYYFKSQIYEHLYNSIAVTLTDSQVYTSALHLVPFPIKNIDDMRMDILSFNNMGASFVINKNNAYMPYLANVNVDANGVSSNRYSHNGLVLKTYQSDIFNNWIKTDWIDGSNGIAEITKIAVTNGAFKIDALNLAEKLYNMLNRVAVSGNTYEDWQDAVYTQSPRRHIESPVYLGGMSNEIVFEEIVQTAPAQIDGETSTLGTLGGRGKLYKRKGGHINVKVDEASMIIGIVSLTPRVCYTQGNDWFNTELKTMDDLHKPALDGIGYEDLIGERLAFWDTKIADDTPISRSKIGKVPAWINYMTDFDRAYGEFAEMDKKGYMVLNRNFEIGNNGTIKDATTYIDPKKYNYAFAYTELEAQNFWVEIYMNIKARRLMSAKQIPNI